MCLYIKTKITNDFIATCSNDIEVYKIVVVINQEIRSPLYRDYIWIPGKHKSIVVFSYGNVANAFHAYLDKPAWQVIGCSSSDILRSIMKLKVNKEHIVALGDFGDIAFSDCELTEEEYNSAFKYI